MNELLKYIWLIHNYVSLSIYNFEIYLDVEYEHINFMDDYVSKTISG